MRAVASAEIAAPVPIATATMRITRKIMRAPEKIDARHLAGHVIDIDTGEGASDVSPLDLFLQRFDLLVHPLEARIDFKRLAIGVERVLVVTDLLQNEAEA